MDLTITASPWTMNTYERADQESIQVQKLLRHCAKYGRSYNLTEPGKISTAYVDGRQYYKIELVQWDALYESYTLEIQTHEVIPVFNCQNEIRS